ncbi:hypothetical protein [Micromonospora echinofusca]|uniref:Flagellin N-terminal-like domain-containing protein n=1 Tax=Micromonospora echinofusca TaxID=47858 RepID=A0ABS3VUL1_MICEH|nr:hypothetical protein [Micromonospora echinofusca]MBO4208229.1 hypothetical protein [Micromonospora echinofusca]
MSFVSYLHIMLVDRLAELRRDDDPERGDGPVPTAIIIAGLAVLAAAVVAWALGIVDDFMDTTIPDTPTGPQPGN